MRTCGEGRQSTNHAKLLRHLECLLTQGGFERVR